MKREKYGYIYRTHLFGNRTVRVTGADNVKQILLGEHRLVSAQWPASVRAILGTETLSNMHGAQHKTKKKVSYFDLSVEGALATAGGLHRVCVQTLNKCVSSLQKPGNSSSVTSVLFRFVTWHQLPPGAEAQYHHATVISVTLYLQI